MTPTTGCSQFGASGCLSFLLPRGEKSAAAGLGGDGRDMRRACPLICPFGASSPRRGEETGGDASLIDVRDKSTAALAHKSPTAATSSSGLTRGSIFSAGVDPRVRPEDDRFLAIAPTVPGQSATFQASSHFTCSAVSAISSAERLSSSSAMVRGPINGITGKGCAMT